MIGPLCRRYLLISLLWSLAFIALLWMVKHSLPLLRPGSPWRLPLAVLPAIPVLAGLAAEARWLRRLDELQQRIALIGLVCGGYAVMGICISAWILERLADVPRLSPLVIFLCFSGFTVLGGWLAARHYR
jgi:hypothetical protein